ncbi:MAG: OmpA family protein [Bacteroidetes bacterium]|nr:OmpA family protein [Bacteroidota bacterium]
MKNTYLLLLPFLLLAIFTTNTSCVGKKKFLSEMANRDSLAHQLNARNLELSREIGQLKLNLAEKTGENNTLREFYDKQVLEIKRLDKEIERLGKQSSSQQLALAQELQQKDAQIAEKEQVITNFGSALQRQQAAVEGVLNELRTAFPASQPGDFYFEQKEGKGYFGISEKVLFRPGTDQFAKTAVAVLEKTAGVLTNHPELQIAVTGHTDNQPVRSKAFKDNWHLSNARATVVVQVLTKDFYLNGSQLTAAGRADFEPKTSNETEEGRATNRRIEMVFAPRVDEVRKLAKEVGGG